MLPANQCVYQILSGCRPKAQRVIDERDRKDYYTPSQSLFTEHCECIVDRYGLRKSLIKQEIVQDIKFNYIKGLSEVDKLFTLQTDKGLHYARTVVLAISTLR